MGMLDFMIPEFLMSEEKVRANRIRSLTDRDSQPEDREAAAHWLASDGDPQSLLGLLSRFDMQLDNQMKDATEKDQVQSLALSLGPEKLKAPLEAWLKKCRVFARPLNMYVQLFGLPAAIAAAMDVLEVEFLKDDLNKPQKKRELLIWLADNQDERLLDYVIKFLDDFDEGVRYAAAEVIISQETDDGRMPLLERLAHPDEDSNRLKTRLAEVFIARRWSVADKESELAERPPHGYTVADGRIAKA